MTITAASTMQRYRKTDQTYELIRSSVLNGEYTPREVLITDDMDTTSGATQTQVRTALERLLTEGLLNVADRSAVEFSVRR